MKRPICLPFQDNSSSTFMPKSRLISKSNPIFVMFSVLLVSCVFSTQAYAQLKSANVQQFEADLIVVNEKIAKIDETINSINARIAGIAPENVDPSVYVRLNDLQLIKEQYTREKISIEAVLDPSQDDSSSDALDEFPSSDNSLSKDNQDQRLDYTNRIE